MLMFFSQKKLPKHRIIKKSEHRPPLPEGQEADDGHARGEEEVDKLALVLVVS